MHENVYPRWFNKLKGKTHTSEPTQSSPYPGLIVWLILVALLFLFISKLSHWFSIEVLGNPSPITREELDWMNQQTLAEQTAVRHAKAEAESFSSLQNAFFIFLFAISLIITIVRIRSVRK